MAFHSLRECLLSGRVLAYPTRDDPFIIYTDSSMVGSGQVLCQVQGGVERVIAFNGSKYNKMQTKWTIYELELFSFITGLKKFYKYLAGADFTWVCDCKSALKILKNQDDMNPRIVRWRAYVSQFRFQTEHRSATAMQHVDMLSRIPENCPDSPESGDGNDSSLAGGAIGAGLSGGGGPAADTQVGSDRACRTNARRPPVPRGTDGGARAGQVTGEVTRGLGPGPPPEPDGAGDKVPAGGCDAGPGSSAHGRVNAVDAELSRLSLDRDSIRWYQKHDKDCRALVHHLKHHKWPT